MASTSLDSFNVEDLRQRNKPQRTDPKQAPDIVSKFNEEERKKGAKRKTFGRTEDGTIFVVPDTQDVISQFFSPSQPKNVGDLVVLSVLACHIALFYFIPTTYRSWILGLVFLFWRIAYDVGIGYLLHIQSKHKRLLTWAQKLELFSSPGVDSNRDPHLHKLVKHEIESRIGQGFKLEDVPIEYNTWLVFRRVVDLVLMSDFLSYCLLAISLGLDERPFEESLSLAILRWIGGVSMILFNVWIKIDAHRVIKDFAWYWGDFFYLVDESPVFDGVFQMAPHPMYSVGYAWYYGVTAIVRSYPLLFISIAAHLMQFAFLITVEMPHMDKTYPEDTEIREQQLIDQLPTIPSKRDPHMNSLYKPSSSIPIDSPRGFDLCRLSDALSLLIPVYCALAVVLMPQDHRTQVLFVLHATFWRVWYAAGLGFVLHCESVRKLWTKHFVKHGESPQEAWNKWKEVYSVSQRMATSTFVAAACKVYSVPDDFFSDYNLLKHVVAVALICLQLVITTSVYDALGDFGMFYGDFFWQVKNAKLNYSKGPYRYLNNPEQFAGMAGLWGAVLLTRNGMIFSLALLAQLLSFVFHYTVERPHQRRLYKQDIRKDSGIFKVIRPFLPEFMQDWDVDSAFDRLVDRLEIFLDDVAPVVMAAVDRLVRNWTTFFHWLPLRQFDPKIGDIDLTNYSIEIQRPDACSGPFTANFGDPIKIRWTAAANHSRKDWIGIYSVSHNTSRRITEISSQGRWIATNAGHYESSTADLGFLNADMPTQDTNIVSGEMLFASDKLWWETGTYEFRYHHNGKHNVLAISQPFEIRIDHFDEDSLSIDEQGLYLSMVEQALLPVLQNCFDRDPHIAPSTATDMFGGAVKKNAKYSKRGVYAIKGLFSIELDPDVIKMDGNVRNLAWRVCIAKKALAPFSMSSSRGRSTPDRTESHHPSINES